MNTRNTTSTSQSFRHNLAVCRLLMLLLVTTVACSVTRDLQAQIDHTFFRQLRARRMFALAEAECRYQLARSELTPQSRIDYVIELARVSGEHAMYVEGDQQAELWSQADSLFLQLLNAPGTHLRNAEIKAQAALVHAQRVEFERWESLLAHTNDDRISAVIQSLDSAIKSVESAETSVRSALQQQQQRRILPQETPPRVLHELHQQLQIQRAQFLLEYASLNDDLSAEQISSGIDAQDLLRKLAASAEDTPNVRAAKRLMLSYARRSGRTQGLAKRLENAEANAHDEAERNAIRAERVRLMMDEDRFLDAAQFLIDARRNTKRLSGELYFLKLQALIRAWQVARESGSAKLADQLYTQVESNAQQAIREAGGFWGRRCQRLAAVAAEAAQYGAVLAELIQAAEQLYAKGEIAESVASYRRAIEEAKQSRQSDIQAELTMTLGSILLNQGHAAEAARTFLARHHLSPQTETGQRAHLLWVFALGREYDLLRTRESRLEYVQSIHAHRELYSQTDTAHEAAWMLARLEERRLQYTLALDLFESIPTGHKRAADAQLRSARCYERILARLHELKRRDQEWAHRAQSQLSEMVVAFPRDSQQWELWHAEVAIRLARITLKNGSDFDLADGLLERAMRALKQHDSTDYSNWQRDQAVQLRILSLAGQNRTREAREFVQQLANHAPAEIMRVLSGLSQVAAQSPAETQQTIGELQLQAVASMRSHQESLSDSQRRFLEDTYAQALVATRQPQKALARYRTILDQHPHDKRILRTVAELEQQLATPELLQSALGHWRNLESLEDAGSPAWIRCRFHVIEVLNQLGQAEEGRKLLAVTRLLYPTLGGPEWAERFAELERDRARN